MKYDNILHNFDFGLILILYYTNVKYDIILLHTNMKYDNILHNFDFESSRAKVKDTAI